MIRQTTELEYEIIGALLQEPDLVRKLEKIIDGEDFSLVVCADLFSAIRESVFETGTFDYHTAADVIRDKIVDPLSFLTRCVEITPTTANAEQHAELLRKEAERERFCQAAQEAMDTEDDPQVAIAALCHKSVQSRRGKRMKSMHDILTDAFVNTTETAKAQRLDTGYQRLDSILKGMWPGQLVLIGARPGCGKSAMCLSLAESIAAKGNRVLYFSLEMLGDELAERLLAKNTEGVNMDNLIDGLPENDMESRLRLTQTMGALNKLPISVYDDPNVTVERIQELAVSYEDLKCIIVDYIGLMNAGKRSESRNLELGQISRDLKKLAQELQIPIVAAAQLNRSVNEYGKPRLSDLRDSGELEQNASKVMFLWREDEGMEKAVGCYVAKNRRGKLGTAHFTFEGEKMLFTELSYRKDEPPDTPRGSRRGGFAG